MNLVLAFIVGALLIAPGPALSDVAYGTWPDNDQRNGKCAFSDWSRFVFVKSVYDGDTFTGDIDMGFELMWVNQKIRFYAVDAPEVRNKNLVDKAKGIEARDWLRDQVSQKWAVITTYKDEAGKFGRKLATICRNGRELVAEMLISGRLVEALY